MAVNKRLSAQVDVLVEAAWGDEYEAEKEKYWKVFEEEYRKEYEAGGDPMGWAIYEDPVDALAAAVDGEDDDKRFIAEILADYKHFWGLIEKIEGCKNHFFNEELVKRADEYLAAP